MVTTVTTRPALRPCPVCSADQITVLHHQRFTLPEDHLLADGYDVVCCDDCGFVYADTAAQQADYDRFYAELSGYESDVSSGMGLSPHDRDRLDGTVALIAAMLDDRRPAWFERLTGKLLRAN